MREVIGSLRIWLVFTVCDTPEVCVWTISELDDTVTCSATPPTSILALALASTGAPSSHRRVDGGLAGRRQHDVLDDDGLEALQGHGHRVGADRQAGDREQPLAVFLGRGHVVWAVQFFLK